MRCFKAIFLMLMMSQPVPAAEDVLEDIGHQISAGKVEGIVGGILSLDGVVQFEAYAKGNSPEKKHDIRSATKSITALLIGVLNDQKAFGSLQQPLAEILPESFSALPAKHPKREISIQDALTMRTGISCNDWVPASLGHEDKMYKTNDWGAFLLAQPMAYEVGKHFSYCTGGVVLLGRVIEKLAEMPLPEFAEASLFSPLGIKGAKWEKTPKGYTDSGGHLRLNLRDLHTIGLLVLNDGQHGEDQLVSKKWVAEMLKPHTGISDRREKYGYLWWYDKGQVKGKDVTLHYAHGNGGTFIFIVPELQLVAAFLGKNYGKREQFLPLQILSQQIVPAIVQ